MSSIKERKIAYVDKKYCVACGCCANVCPIHAVSIVGGSYALVAEKICVGCGKCKKECPASVITIRLCGEASK